MNKPSAEQPKASRGFRVTLRCGRALVLLLLLLAASLLYLNQVGLPAFMSGRVEDQLRAHGLDLQMDRLRLRGWRTWIADNVRWRKTPSAIPSDLAIRRAELLLNGGALWRFQLQLESLIVRQGRWNIAFLSSNSPPAHLPVEEINLELRFLPDGRWDLPRLEARCKNAVVQASGTITNAVALSGPRPSEAAAKKVSPWSERLHWLATELERITFSPSSNLRVTFQADGRDAASLRVKLELQSAQASAAWGAMEDLRLSAEAAPSQTASRTLDGKCDLQIGGARFTRGGFTKAELAGQFILPVTNLNLSHGQWRLRLDNPQTDWASADQFSAAGKAVPRPEPANQMQDEFTLEAHGLRTPVGKVGSSVFTAELVRTSGPWDGSWRLELKRIESSWAEAEAAALAGHLRRPSIETAPDRADVSWGWWQKLEPYSMDWDGQIDGVTASGVQIEQISGAGEWRAPEFAIRKLSTQISGGQLEMTAALDVSKREVQSRLAGNFDLHRLEPLLATNTQRWIQQFHWETPPRVQAEARVLLPAWTNREPDRFKEALKTLAVSGSFAAAKGAYRSVPVNSARSQFYFSNSVWRLPDLVVVRPEGEVHLDGAEDTATREFHWAIQSRIDPKALAPLLAESEQRVLDYFKFGQPPSIQGEVRGQWRNPDRVGFSARVAATNLAFRSEAFDRFQASMQFTNQLLEFTDVKIRRGNEQVSATKVVYDPKANLVHVTNGVSTMDPDLVTRIISAPVRAAVAPYHFKEPPSVVVNGRLPTRAEADADATFKIAGKTFNYWRFKVPEISGDVHWRGETVTITNLQAAFYRGKLDWEGKFDFSGPPGARYQFRGHAAQSDLQSLVADLTLTNTPLEGTFDGNLIVTSADTRDWLSWQGSGNVQFRDGFLWNVPIFGFFSPVLNKIVPGFGQSRVNAGSANFVIDQGLIRTSDLEMKAPALRLQYVGSVNFKGAVNARVQAEILRDAWAVGRIVSMALWPVTKVFEYKVTGTLYEPKSQLLYFPKFLMLPFRPLKAIKDVLIPPTAAPSPQPPPPDAKGKNPTP